MWLVQQDNQIICSCGNDIFISMGDIFGYTAVECIKCGCSNSIMDNSLTSEKLLSQYGEDYCKIFGKILVEQTIFEDGVLIVDYLLFTEFDTAIMVSAKDRLDKVMVAKEEAIKNERFEKAGRLSREELIINCTLRQQKGFLML